MVIYGILVIVAFFFVCVEYEYGNGNKFKKAEALNWCGSSKEIHKRRLRLNYIYMHHGTFKNFISSKYADGLKSPVSLVLSGNTEKFFCYISLASTSDDLIPEGERHGGKMNDL